MNVDDTVLGVLSAAVCEGKTLRLTEQLDRKLYLATNQVLEACGGKWDKKTRMHRFVGEAQPLIDSVIFTGEVRTAQEDGWFPTPPDLADRLAGAADLGAPTEKFRILEPSAGEGSLVRAIRKIAPRATLVAVEINPSRCKTLEKLEDPHLHVLQADFDLFTRADPPDELAPVFTDFYDRVVMNPPFARGQDVDHVSGAFRLLKPGGRLVAIMSAGVRFRQDRRYREFQALLDAYGTVEPLPEKAFSMSGTNVRTVLVTLTRR